MCKRGNRKQRSQADKSQGFRTGECERLGQGKTNRTCGECQARQEFGNIDKFLMETGHVASGGGRVGCIICRGR